MSESVGNFKEDRLLSLLRSLHLVVTRVAKIVTIIAAIYSLMHCNHAWIYESMVVQNEHRNSDNSGNLTDRPQQISAEDKQTVIFK